MNRDYFEREENTNKCPINWKECLNKSEVENIAIGSSVELILIENENELMKFPYDAKLFGDPNAWI